MKRTKISVIHRSLNKFVVLVTVLKYVLSDSVLLLYNWRRMVASDTHSFITLGVTSNSTFN